MAIVDVEVPSGYIYTGWKYADNAVSVIVVIRTAVCDYTLALGCVLRLLRIFHVDCLLLWLV